MACSDNMNTKLSSLLSTYSPLPSTLSDDSDQSFGSPPTSSPLQSMLLGDDLSISPGSPSRQRARRRLGGRASPLGPSKRPCARTLVLSASTDYPSSADEYVLPTIPAGYLPTSCGDHSQASPRSIKKMRSRADQPSEQTDDFALKLTASKTRIPAVCEKFLLSLMPRQPSKLPFSCSPPAKTSIIRDRKRHYREHGASDFEDEGYLSSSC